MIRENGYASPEGVEGMDMLAAFAEVSEIVSPVVLVGGSVRDRLMGRTSQDFDFATPYSADELESMIRESGRKPYLVGKRYGTVGVRLHGKLVEVSTLAGGAPPMSLDERVLADLARRDFTINAMAFDGRDLIDPFGGRDDIARRIVRAVGDAGERFSEDPLRVLRAARFMSQLDFSLDEGTRQAMVAGSQGLLRVARERWMLEYDALLVGPGVAAALQALSASGALRYTLPELQWQVDAAGPDGLPVFSHTVSVVSAVASEPALRWAALLHDVGGEAARGGAGESCLIGAEIVERIALALKWSIARRVEVARLVRGQADPANPLFSAHLSR